MNFQKKLVKNLCSFYVSDWHLVTMLLPYINKSINEGVKIATVLEKDIKENVCTLLERLNLKTNEQILNINWTRTNEKKYANICKILDKTFSEKQLIIVNGTKDYIERAKENINRYIDKNKEKLVNINSKIKIVSCYEIVDFNGSIQEILDNSDKILNTSGEKEIEEIFEDYEKKEKIG